MSVAARTESPRICTRSGVTSSAWTCPDLLPDVFAEFRRVLAPGGQVVLAFQVGDERVHLAQAYGHAVSIDAYRLVPDRIADLLTGAGLVVHTQIRREAVDRERTPQAYLTASRPSVS